MKGTKPLEEAKLLEARPRPGASVRLGAYLRRLREGYGYSLRRVEERALALGEPIDNSQLSRFEKGKALPSFEKLRALARIFNVSVQNFSDILDLEQYEPYKPSSGTYEELMAAGHRLFHQGEHGRAFVTYERALEVAEEGAGEPQRREQAVEARRHMALALWRLGKLSMTEQELRRTLKEATALPPRARLRSLLLLGYVYRELGDLYLASVVARDCLEVAEELGDLEVQAGVLNTLGNIANDQGDFARALEFYRRAQAALASLGGHEEMAATLLANLGGCLVGLRRFDEGMARIREALVRARQLGLRRVACLALTKLGEAYLERGDRARALSLFAESDAAASRPDESYTDILFLNAFHRWTLARQDRNPTKEKIAFGRLRYLRSLLERRFPEVEAFDRAIEQARRKHHGQAG
jgi:transcriptional regulator with XRE-family HTH domain